VIKKDGFFGCYKGYPLLLMNGVPKAYVRFGIFDFMMNQLKEETIPNKIIAGFTAGFFESFVHIPFENMKIKVIHDWVMPTPKYKSLPDAIVKVSKELGWRGVTKGTLPNIAKESTS